MFEEQEKKKGMFSKIASREDALKVIKDTSMGFFVVAGLQAALSFLVGFSVLFDAAIYVVGGFFLRRFYSRVAAIVLLLLAIAGAGVTIANKGGANLGGGNNIFLAFIILWAAIRAVEATFKLRGQFSPNQQPTKQRASNKAVESNGLQSALASSQHGFSAPTTPHLAHQDRKIEGARMTSIALACPLCGFSKSVPVTKIPSRTVNVTCPQCRQIFPFQKDLTASTS